MSCIFSMCVLIGLSPVKAAGKKPGEQREAKTEVINSAFTRIGSQLVLNPGASLFKTSASHEKESYFDQGHGGAHLDFSRFMFLFQFDLHFTSMSRAAYYLLQSTSMSHVVHDRSDVVHSVCCLLLNLDLILYVFDNRSALNYYEV